MYYDIPHGTQITKDDVPWDRNFDNSWYPPTCIMISPMVLKLQKMISLHSSEHSTILMISPHVHHDSPMVLCIPTVLKITPMVLMITPMVLNTPQYSRYSPHLSWYPPRYWTSPMVLKISPTVVMISPTVVVISPMVLMISPHGSHDIPHGTHDIPHGTRDIPQRYWAPPHGPAHIIQRDRGKNKKLAHLLWYNSLFKTAWNGSLNFFHISSKVAGFCRLPYHTAFLRCLKYTVRTYYMLQHIFPVQILH